MDDINKSEKKNKHPVLLITKKPWVIDEWDYEKNDRDVRTVIYKSDDIVYWKCFRGHSFEMNMVQKKKGQCPYCSGHRVLKGFNDLLSQNPALAFEWDYDKNKGLTDVHGNDVSTPDKVTCGSGLKVWWKCKSGHSWQAKICDRNMKRGKCPYCNQNNVVK